MHYHEKSEFLIAALDMHLATGHKPAAAWLRALENYAAVYHPGDEQPQPARTIDPDLCPPPTPESLAAIGDAIAAGIAAALRDETLREALDRRLKQVQDHFLGKQDANSPDHR